MSKSFLNIKLIITTLLIACLSFSCKKKETDETDADADSINYAIESAVSDAGQMAYSVEAEELTFSIKNETPRSNIKTTSANHILAACDYATARSACSDTFQTIVDWNGCSLTQTNSSGTTTATIKGTITESYSGFGAATCKMTGDGSQVKRAISTTNPWVLTFSSGATLTRDMVPGTAFDGETFPTAAEGTTITRVESGTSNGLSCTPSARCYNLVANGLHKTFKGPRGRTWFEHILNSDVSFTGTKSAGTRAMSGTVNVWHEVAEYKAANTFTAVTWGSASCCYPTSGSISTVLTGSVTGTMSMAFSSTCGEVTVTGTDASTSTVNLTQCSE